MPYRSEAQRISSIIGIGAVIFGLIYAFIKKRATGNKKLPKYAKKKGDKK